MSLVQKQPVSVNGVEFDATIDGTETHEATIPDYPIDEGYNVADNVSLKALELEMTLYLTATPVTYHSNRIGMEGVLETIDELIRIQRTRQPITVLTSDKTYENMVIENIEIKKSQDDGFSREISATFKQVDIVSAATVTVPAKTGKAGKSKTKAGTAKTQSASVSKSSGSKTKDSGKKKSTIGTGYDESNHWLISEGAENTLHYELPWLGD